jgi:hypothetical protein
MVCVKNKKPAIDWQSRVLEILFICWLESSSHNATTRRNKAPNGHLALAARGAQTVIKRGVHFQLRPSIKHTAPVVSNCSSRCLPHHSPVPA